MIKKVFRLILLTLLFLVSLPVLANAIKFQQRIYGLSRKSEENAELRLELLAKDQEPLTPAKIQTLYQQAPTEILQALQPYGYFRATVVDKRLNIRGNRYTAEYRVNPGEPIRITQVSIQVIGPGANDPSIQAYLASNPLQVGRPLRTQRYLNVKQALLNTAQLTGYLTANFTTHTIAISLKNYTADITLVMDTGPRYYFGTTTFSPTPYDNRFLARYLPYKEGDPFNSSAILTLQNNLASSVYFQKVNAQSNVQKAQNYRVPVYVELVPKKAIKYSAGLGYGTDTGVRGSLGWEWRRISPFGDYMQAVIQASQIQNAFQAKYVIPGKNPVLQRYEIIAGINTNQPNDGQYRTYETGLNYVNNIGDWTQTYSLTYQHERFNVDSTTPSITTDYIVPNMSFQKVDADNQINTRNGYRLFLDLSGGKGLNVNSDFVQAELQAKYITTFWRDNRLILRDDVGATAVQNLNEFPLSLRFFAGGSQSVRGFDYQSLGPGKYLAVGSIEYQRRVYGKFYFATFYDAGNAFNELPTNILRSAGIGVVYQSPMGPVELTVAKPLNTGNNNFSSFAKGLRFQFVVGPDL